MIPLFHESNSDNLISKADERKGKNNRVVSVNHKQGHTKQVLLVIAAIIKIIKIRKYF